TSLPEIGGNCAFYFDNLSPQNMAETININIKNMSNDLPEKLKANAAKFSWEKCIDNYINYYLKILNIK
ncbi:MAG: glycosyltransferase family 1 protein, partial [Bacteroidales bacterium]|nr:glycosyltransferase family 1 protein [Bacteroidales bacterium]